MLISNTAIATIAPMSSRLSQGAVTSSDASARRKAIVMRCPRSLRISANAASTDARNAQRIEAARTFLYQVGELDWCLIASPTAVTTSLTIVVAPPPSTIRTHKIGKLNTKASSAKASANWLQVLRDDASRGGSGGISIAISKCSCKCSFKCSQVLSRLRYREIKFGTNYGGSTD